LRDSAASKQVAWEEEMRVLNERCGEANYDKSLVENDLEALKVIFDLLKL